MKHKILLIFLALLVAFPAHSAPSRNKKVVLVQPDGTAFPGRVNGDEFMKVITTDDGCAVIQDAEKWWCYAFYDDGRKVSSGQRVGAEASSEVLNQSRNIPYQQLSANARTQRASRHHPAVKPLLERLDTKSGGTTKHGLIILAEFSDLKFTHKKEDFVNMLTQKGYNKNGAIGSAKEYFDDQFGGSIEFDFDVSPIITLPRNVAYYGENDAKDNDLRAEYMIYDACVRADEFVDFSLYDDDGDGYVDNVFVFFAGADEAEGAGDDRIWSHAWDLESAKKPLMLDGVHIGSYACTAELARIPVGMTRYKEVLAGIGVFCHEYFHTFGIPDFYDTDYEGSGGKGMALWLCTALMDAGNQNNDGNTPPYLNAIERDYLGLTKPQKIDSNGSYTLEPIHLNGQYYRIDTDHKDEYYILECRSNDKWDEHIGGSGMLVYHIDKSNRSAGPSETYEMDLTAYDRWEIYNEVNCRPDHQCADLVEADGRSDIETEDIYDSYNIKNIFFPTTRVNAIHPNGNPSFKFWSGDPADLSITNIKRSGNNITFNVVGLFSVSTDVFADAAIIAVEYDKDYEGDIIIQWGEINSGEREMVRVEPYAPGGYSATLEGLKPDNVTYQVKVFIEVNGVAEEIKTVTFMTRKRPSVDWPVMALGNWNRSGEVLLPLRLYNAGDAAEIRWTYNGVPVSRGGNGYFVPQQSGTLRADIIWNDGTEEAIIKEITIGEGAK